MKTQKLSVASIALVSSLMVHPGTSRAQDFAPVSLAGSLLTVKVTNGRAPFASNGNYRMFTSVAGTNYTVLGPAGPLKSGACEYHGTGSTGRETLVDAQGGSGTSVQLSFASPTNGTLALTNGSGFQIGLFTLGNYADRTAPQLFQPGVTNGQFQSYLNGQPGFIYAIETSSNLVNWQPWLEVSVADLNTSFADASGLAARFYRARVSSTAFAPGALTNKTFNLTITDGQSPLATNGICQWLAEASGNGYQMIGGPGTTSNSGQYTYTRTGPDSGLIACQDSLAGTLSEQLVFTSPGSGYFYTTNSAGFEAGTFTLADGPVEFLGNVKFTPDTVRARSLLFAADGAPASLSVTSAAGWVWTLNFPADALLTPRTITMTPFLSVDASQTLLPIAAGVQLSPDGLQFSDGVTLTVTAPAPLGPHAALLMGKDGSDLRFVSITNQANRFSTTLFHFSSPVVTDPSDPQWNQSVSRLLVQAQAAYQNALKQLKSLSLQVVQPPEPPDYDWKCDPSGQDDQIDAYQEALFAKEDDAWWRFLAAAKTLEWLGTEVPPDDSIIARGWYERAIYRKVDSLFSDYSGNPKKFMAVTRTALKIMCMDQLVGGTGRDDWGNSIHSWGKRVMDYGFDQLRNAHKYSKTLTLTEMARVLPLLGAYINMNDFFDRLGKALMFKLTLEMNFTFSDWDSEGTLDDKVTETAEGEVTLQAGLTTPFTVVTNRIKFVSGGWADYLGDCAYGLDGGQSSVWRMVLGLQPCNQPAQVIIVLNGPLLPSETWTGCEDVSLPNPWCGVIYGSAFVCQPAGANGAGGVFRFPLEDGEAEVVDENVPGENSAGPCADPLQRATGTIQFHLEHTPQ